MKFTLRGRGIPWARLGSTQLKKVKKEISVKYQEIFKWPGLCISLHSKL